MNVRSRNPERRGATAVEFAVVAPIFFLVVLGIFEFGRMVSLQHAMVNAARVGCRTAGLASTNNSSDVETEVREQLESVIGSTAWDSDSTRVTVPETLGGTASNTDLVVSIELDYDAVTWLPFALTENSPVLTVTARRRRE